MAGDENEWVRVPRDPDGSMWSIGRAEFIRKAQDYADARSSEKASFIADIAGSDIYRAMLAAAPTPEDGFGDARDAARYRWLVANVATVEHVAWLWWRDDEECTHIDNRIDAAIAALEKRS